MGVILHLSINNILTYVGEWARKFALGFVWWLLPVIEREWILSWVSDVGIRLEYSNSLDDEQQKSTKTITIEWEERRYFINLHLWQKYFAQLIWVAVLVLAWTSNASLGGYINTPSLLVLITEGLTSYYKSFPKWIWTINFLHELALGFIRYWLASN